MGGAATSFAMDFLWGAPPPKKSPQEQSKEWRRELKKQQRSIERDISKMDKEMKKQEAEIKKVAKKDLVAAKMLAKSLVGMRKTQERLYIAKANMSSVENQLISQQAQMKMA